MLGKCIITNFSSEKRSRALLCEIDNPLPGQREIDNRVETCVITQKKIFRIYADKIIPKN